MNIQAVANKSKKIMESIWIIVILLTITFTVALFQSILLGIGEMKINGKGNNEIMPWLTIWVPTVAATFGTFGTVLVARLNPKFFWPEFLQNIFFFANAFMLALWFDAIMWVMLGIVAIRMKLKWDKDSKHTILKTKHIGIKEFLQSIVWVGLWVGAVAVPWKLYIPESHVMYHPNPILDMAQLAMASFGLYLGVSRICEMHIYYVLSALLGMIVYAMNDSFVMIINISGYFVTGTLAYFTWIAAVDK